MHSTSSASGLERNRKIATQSGAVFGTEQKVVTVEQNKKWFRVGKEQKDV